MQRLYEQRVQAALERLIGPPPGPGADAAAQQARLRLLADAYGRTQQLTLNLGRATKGSAVDLGALSEGLFPAFLAGYPAQELQWLQAAFEEEVRASCRSTSWLCMLVILVHAVVAEE